MIRKIMVAMFLFSFCNSCTTKQISQHENSYISMAEVLCLNGKSKHAFNTLIKGLSSDSSYSVSLKLNAIYLNQKLNSVTHNNVYSKAIKEQIVTTYCSYYPFPDKDKITPFVDLYINDQMPRKYYSRKSESTDSIEKEFNRLDSSNMLKAIQLISSYNVDSFLSLGKFPSLVLYYLIAHSKLEYQKKYYPLLDTLTQKGYIAKHDLALIEDQMLLNAGGSQKYGIKLGYSEYNGQFYVHPVLCVDSVNYYRNLIGLKQHQDSAYLFEINDDTLFFTPSNILGK